MSSGENASRTFLVVDDLDMGRRVVRRMLELIEPCEVREAMSGEEALDLLAEAGGSIDAVVADYRMPGIHGVELLKRLRMGETGAPPGLPFALATFYDDARVAGVAISLDADAFLPKPVSAAALEIFVGRLSEGGEGRPGLKSPEYYSAIDADMPLAEVLRQSLAADAEASAGPAVLRQAAGGERRVQLSDIPANSVLARDLGAAAGDILLPAGHTLTDRVVGLLRDLSGLQLPLEEVWILAD